MIYRIRRGIRLYDQLVAVQYQRACTNSDGRNQLQLTTVPKLDIRLLCIDADTAYSSTKTKSSTTSRLEFITLFATVTLHQNHFNVQRVVPFRRKSGHVTNSGNRFKRLEEESNVRRRYFRLVADSLNIELQQERIRSI
ncbi:hypothetical protein A8H32_08255 [Burkholderia thailandensis]|nr:hypothetical protein AQ475_02010 [Burkholderia thailandensis]AVR25108.1 hypothetical protein A8H32_08255 [Burkholderia thailandensis]